MLTEPCACAQVATGTQATLPPAPGTRAESGSGTRDVMGMDTSTHIPALLKTLTPSELAISFPEMSQETFQNAT